MAVVNIGQIERASRPGRYVPSYANPAATARATQENMRLGVSRTPTMTTPRRSLGNTQANAAPTVTQPTVSPERGP